ncbi:unnamed protein product, partial [Hapterophycus canaliculatus]
RVGVGGKQLVLVGRARCECPRGVCTEFLRLDSAGFRLWNETRTWQLLLDGENFARAKAGPCVMLFLDNASRGGRVGTPFLSWGRSGQGFVLQPIVYVSGRPNR